MPAPNERVRCFRWPFSSFLPSLSSGAKDAPALTPRDRSDASSLPMLRVYAETERGAVPGALLNGQQGPASTSSAITIDLTRADSLAASQPACDSEGCLLLALSSAALVTSSKVAPYENQEVDVSRPREPRMIRFSSRRRRDSAQLRALSPLSTHRWLRALCCTLWPHRRGWDRVCLATVIWIGRRISNRQRRDFCCERTRATTT